MYAQLVCALYLPITQLFYYVCFVAVDYVCPTCGKKGRHNHLKAQKLGKPRKSQVCQQCGARYSTISGLKFHQLQKHKIGIHSVVHILAYYTAYCNNNHFSNCKN